jgi:8-oxo-dGTP diphosphatase
MQNSIAQYCIRCGTHLEMSIYQDGHEHPVCPSCGWAYFPDPKVAAAAVVQRDGLVLLVKRVFDPMQGYWSLPAGFVNAFEDPARAAEREVKEETGLDVQAEELLQVLTGREHPRGADLVLIYRMHLLGGDIQAQDDAEDARFFSLDDLPPLAFRATRLALGLPE